MTYIGAHDHCEKSNLPVIHEFSAALSARPPRVPCACDQRLVNPSTGLSTLQALWPSTRNRLTAVREVGNIPDIHRPRLTGGEATAHAVFKDLRAGILERDPHPLAQICTLSPVCPYYSFNVHMIHRIEALLLIQMPESCAVNPTCGPIPSSRHSCAGPAWSQPLPVIRYAIHVKVLTLGLVLR